MGKCEFCKFNGECKFKDKFQQATADDGDIRIKHIIEINGRQLQSGICIPKDLPDYDFITKEFIEVIPARTIKAILGELGVPCFEKFKEVEINGNIPYLKEQYSMAPCHYKEFYE